jgi:hypothetical protein
MTHTRREKNLSSFPKLLLRPFHHLTHHNGQQQQQQAQYSKKTTTACPKFSGQ